jgi:hypothetical protein
MKIRVYDSDGVFRGGLFNTRKYNAMSCRMWHGFPNPNYREHLIDINGLGKRSSKDSWYLLRESRHPEMSGPSDGSDSFDSSWGYSGGTRAPRPDLPSGHPSLVLRPGSAQSTYPW